MIEKDLLVNSTYPKFKIGEHKISLYDPVSLWESISNVIDENNKKNIERLDEIDKETQNNFNGNRD